MYDKLLNADYNGVTNIKSIPVTRTQNESLFTFCFPQNYSSL